jgi:rare lipoprotein A
VSGVGRVWRALRTGSSSAVALPRARRGVCLLLASSLAFSLASCRSEDNGEKLGERVIPLGQPVPKGGGTYRIGDPYQVAGVWHYPREDPAYDRVGTASWYGELFHGRRTANGEIYDMDRLSAAHPTLPLPVYVQVTNLANRRAIVVRINDRGPYANDRIIDLSRRSAELLGFRDDGTATVRVQYLGRAPLNGDDSYERRYVANQSWMHVASNVPTGRGAQDASVGSLPSEKPSLPSQARGADLTVASMRPPEPQGAMALRWQASGEVPARLSFAGGEATVTSAKPPPAATVRSGLPPNGLLVQVGSFKNKANADRARSELAGLGPVEVAPMEVGGAPYFRVRVGPFKGGAEAQAALARVTQVGYMGATIVSN